MKNAKMEAAFNTLKTDLGGFSGQNERDPSTLTGKILIAIDANEGGDAKITLLLKTFYEDLKILRRWTTELHDLGTVDQLDDCYVAIPKCISRIEERIADCINLPAISAVASAWSTVSKDTNKFVNSSMRYAFPVLKKTLTLLIYLYKSISSWKIDVNGKVTASRPIFNQQELNLLQEYSGIFHRNLEDLYNYIDEVKYDPECTGTEFDSLTDKYDSIVDRKTVIDALTENGYPGLTTLKYAFDYGKNYRYDTQMAVTKAGETWKTIKNGLLGGGSLNSMGYSEEDGGLGVVETLITTVMSYLRSVIVISDGSEPEDVEMDGKTVKGIDPMREEYTSDKDVNIHRKYKTAEKKELSQTIRAIDLVREYRDEILTKYREWLIKILRTAQELQRHVVFYKQGDDTEHDWLTTGEAYATDLDAAHQVVEEFMLENTEASTVHDMSDDGKEWKVYTTIKENNSLRIASKEYVGKLHDACLNIDELIKWILSDANYNLTGVHTFDDFEDQARDRLAAIGCTIGDAPNYSWLSYSPSFSNSELITIWGREEEKNGRIVIKKKIDVYKDVNAAMHGYKVTDDKTKQADKVYFELNNGAYTEVSNPDLSDVDKDYYEKWTEVGSPVEDCAFPAGYGQRIKDLISACNRNDTWNKMNVDNVRLAAAYLGNLLKIKVQICNIYKDVWRQINDPENNRNEETRSSEEEG